MALNAKKIQAPTSKARVQQEELPVGNYMCRVAQIVDLGIRPREKWDTVTNGYVIDNEKAPCQVMMVTYEFTTEFVKDAKGVEDQEKPRWLSETLNLFSLDIDLATSTKRYKAIDPLISKDGDWTQLVGAPCMVTIVQKKNGKSKIGSVAPAIKGVPMPELKNEPKVFLMDDPDMEIFGSLPEWLQEKITTALNYQGSELAVARGDGVETVDDAIKTLGKDAATTTGAKQSTTNTTSSTYDVNEDTPW